MDKLKALISVTLCYVTDKVIDNNQVMYASALILFK